MRMFCQLFLAAVSVFVMCGAASGLEIDSDKYGAQWNINEDISVQSGVVRDVEDIFIERSVLIENHGNLYGDVHVCDGCEFFIKNSGYIDGAIYVGYGATVTQIVDNRSELQPLDIRGAFSLVIGDIGWTDWDDVLTVGTSADKIILQNTSIVLNGANEYSVSPVIEVLGTVQIRVENAHDLDGRAILTNVVGDVAPVVFAESDNPLFIASGVFQDGNVYLEFVREMDYLKILGPGQGDFINLIREVNPDDAFLAALDGANTMDDLYRIMRRSVRMRPINLMRPINIFNEMTGWNALGARHGDGVVISLNPEYIASDDFSIYAVRGGVALNLGVFHVGVGGHAGRVESLDDYDEYFADFYGGDLTLGYDDNRLYWSGRIGMTVADFETPSLYDAGDIIYNPRGKMRYVESDVGFHLYPLDGLKITPFIGMRSVRECLGSVARDKQTVRAGADVNLTRAIDDTEYTYGLRVAPNFDGGINADVHMDFWSKYDAAGGGIIIAVHHDDIVTAYRVSVNLRYMF